jgi:Leucine-rich repeat (LRR) protein
VDMEGGLPYGYQTSWSADSGCQKYLPRWLPKDLYHPVLSVHFWRVDDYKAERHRMLARLRSDLPGLEELTIAGDLTTPDVEQIIRVRTLRSLEFHQNNFEISDLSILARASRLENLAIGLEPRNDDELSPLTRLTKLRRLSIRGPYSDEPSARLAGPWLAAFPQLEEFESLYFPLDSRAAERLAALPRLKRLSLGWTNMDDSALAYLGQLTGLEHLDLSGTQITDAGLDHLSSLTNLKQLRLNQTKITGSNLSFLAGMKHLEELDLSQTELNSDAMNALCQLPSLRELYLSQTHIGDAGLRRLGEFRRLKVLDLRDTDVSDLGWSQLAWPPWLDSLRLQGTCVTQAALTDLLKCPTLQDLEVEESQFDAQDVLVFQQARPAGLITRGYPRYTGRRYPLPIGDY